MPVGVMVNVASVVLGGIMGSLFGGKLPDRIKKHMNGIFGICAWGMGISAIVLMKNMPAVVFSVIVGTMLGLCMHLGERIRNITGVVLRKVRSGADEQQTQLLLTVVVLFCASGTGIYGSLDSGMTGNHSILITKSILDFFTAMIFAAQLGSVVALIGVPQLAIMGTIFLLAKVIYPLTTPEMILDFKACGGFLLLVTGVRMLDLKDMPVADMLPAVVLAMPVSFCWTQWILPLVG